jgi:acyl-CoA reductase-like NAD-dependent aldehyde dehydrogenase
MAVVRDKLYVGGEWVSPSRPDTIVAVDSGTEEVLGTVPDASPEDGEAAVSAAREALADWSRRAPAERAGYCSRVADGLGRRMAELGELITREVGTPINLSTLVQVGLPTTTFASMSGLVGEVPFEETVGHSLVVREAVGVVAAITPWNYPLHQIAAKVAPALAAGCPRVLKPSEVAPLNAFVLAEIMEEAGLPDGVFNLVSGRGPGLGESIVSNAEVDMVSFTGSLRTGRRVAELAGAGVKRVTLELGGKSATLVLRDADLERAVTAGITMCFLNSGQTCIALSRMLVPRDRLGEAEEIAAKVAESYTVGDPFDSATLLGPLASSRQRERVLGYIRRGLDEGARLIAGGIDPPDGLEKGFYVRPTVFSEVRRDMVIANEEIFGPVLCIIAYDTEDEAVEIANDSIYGLSGAVWSRDVAHGVEVARRIRTGQVDMNGAMFNPLAPFGGVKQSGYGRELGKFGLAEFLETKSIQL